MIRKERNILVVGQEGGSGDRVRWRAASHRPTILMLVREELHEGTIEGSEE